MKLPFVSIVIPTFNDSYYITQTLTSILNQFEKLNYRFETIVIDNCSTDNTIETIKAKFPDVLLLTEFQNTNSPYSCRNRGIEKSSGDVIILLDATCVPEPDWLVNGLEYLEKQKADIVGGNVLFDFEGKITSGKIYDSLTNIKMKESIQKGVAKTANLFIRRQVFSAIGNFPEGIRSGADVRWTYKATKAGMKMVFCESAVVKKPARGFKELLKKQWRVGIHQPLIWKDQGKKVTKMQLFKKIITPVSPIAVKRLLKEKGNAEMQKFYPGVLLTAQMVKITSGLSNILGLRKLK
jgi:glycosyltransferase involved in cell wall biosynthesis